MHLLHIPQHTTQISTVHISVPNCVLWICEIDLFLSQHMESHLWRNIPRQLMLSVLILASVLSMLHIFILPKASFCLWVLSLPVSVCVCLCVSLCLNHLFVSAITPAIYPLLNMWVCPCEKSPPIEVRNFISRPKMHLSPVKVRIDFGVDWPCMIFSLIFNFKPVFCLNKLCVSYSFASFSIYLVRPHGSAHILIFMHADWVLPWTVKQSRFMYWWDHWSSASLNWILQASISFRHNTGTHAGIARLRIDQHYF